MSITTQEFDIAALRNPTQDVKDVYNALSQGIQGIDGIYEMEDRTL